MKDSKTPCTDFSTRFIIKNKLGENALENFPHSPIAHKPSKNSSKLIHKSYSNIIHLEYMFLIKKITLLLPVIPNSLDKQQVPSDTPS